MAVGMDGDHRAAVEGIPERMDAACLVGECQSHAPVGNHEIVRVDMAGDHVLGGADLFNGGENTVVIGIAGNGTGFVLNTIGSFVTRIPAVVTVAFLQSDI